VARVRRRRQAFSARDLAFTADGKCLVAASGDRMLSWDVPSGTLGFRADIHHLTAFALSRDGKWVATGAPDKSVRLWRLPAGVPGSVLKGHSGLVRALDFSQNGKWLASGAQDNTVRLWNLSTGKLAAMLKGHADEVTRVRFSSDEKWVASCSKDNTVGLVGGALGQGSSDLAPRSADRRRRVQPRCQVAGGTLG
jgi:WD40 repeat protein